MCQHPKKDHNITLEEESSIPVAAAPAAAPKVVLPVSTVPVPAAAEAMVPSPLKVEPLSLPQTVHTSGEGTADAAAATEERVGTCGTSTGGVEEGRGPSAATIPAELNDMRHGEATSTDIRNSIDDHAASSAAIATAPVAENKKTEETKASSSGQSSRDAEIEIDAETVLALQEKAAMKAQAAEADRLKCVAEAEEAARLKGVAQAEAAVEAARLKSIADAEEVVRLKEAAAAAEALRLKLAEEEAIALQLQQQLAIEEEEARVRAAEAAVIAAAEAALKLQLQAEEEARQKVKRDAEELAATARRAAAAAELAEVLRLQEIVEAREREVIRLRAKAEADAAEAVASLKRAEADELARLSLAAAAAAAARLEVEALARLKSIKAMAESAKKLRLARVTNVFGEKRSLSLKSLAVPCSADSVAASPAVLFDQGPAGQGQAARANNNKNVLTARLMLEPKKKNIKEFAVPSKAATDNISGNTAAVGGKSVVGDPPVGTPIAYSGSGGGMTIDKAIVTSPRPLLGDEVTQFQLEALFLTTIGVGGSGIGDNCNRDGFLGKAQLLSCLKHLGFTIRPTVVSKYFFRSQGRKFPFSNFLLKSNNLSISVKTF